MEAMQLFSSSFDRGTEGSVELQVSVNLRIEIYLKVDPVLTNDSINNTRC
jgi:hypothetical protein